MLGISLACMHPLSIPCSANSPRPQMQCMKLQHTPFCQSPSQHSMLSIKYRPQISCNRFQQVSNNRFVNEWVLQAGEVDAKMLGALLAGVRRAFPFVEAAEAEALVTVHSPALFKIVHTATFGVAVQAGASSDTCQVSHTVLPAGCCDWVLFARSARYGGRFSLRHWIAQEGAKSHMVT